MKPMVSDLLSPAKHQLNMLGISSSSLLLLETSLDFDFERLHWKQEARDQKK